MSSVAIHSIPHKPFDVVLAYYRATLLPVPEEEELYLERYNFSENEWTATVRVKDKPEYFMLSHNALLKLTRVQILLEAQYWTVTDNSLDNLK